MKTQQKPTLVKRSLYQGEYRTKKTPKVEITVWDGLFIAGMVAFVVALILLVGISTAAS